MDVILIVRLNGKSRIYKLIILINQIVKYQKELQKKCCNLIISYGSIVLRKEA
jgi:hypothetical protein